MRYFNGQDEINLTPGDFKAQGGEASVYVKDGVAYKIYSDPQRMISLAKIRELAVLTRPSIISPMNVVYDAKNTAVGYAMPYLEKVYALCQTFPKAFRQRVGLTPEKVLRLVQNLQETVHYIHGRGILLVDLNEMNFLVSHDLRDIYAIDTDSYQTPSGPATALMETVRDRHATGFNSGTDWFSFAVVSFQMFVGLHPFRGSYAPLSHIPDQLARLDARMRGHISVLHTGVNVPSACLPLSVIPPAYLDWYRAVLEHGQRIAPPANVQPVISLAHSTATIAASGEVLTLREWAVFAGEIVAHQSGFTLTTEGVYQGARRLCDTPAANLQLAQINDKQAVLAWLDGARVCLREASGGQDVRAGFSADEISAHEGRLYARQGGNLAEIILLAVGKHIVAQPRIVGQVLPHATQLFPGVALQSLLGAVYASLLPASGVCYQLRLKELDGYQIIDAKLSGTVLGVWRARAGVYDRLIYRFADDFSGYDVKITPDVTLTGANFVTLASGVCLLLNEQDELEIFPRHAHAPGCKVLPDNDTLRDAKLYGDGRQALLARGRTLYLCTMKH